MQLCSNTSVLFCFILITGSGPDLATHPHLPIPAPEGGQSVAAYSKGPVLSCSSSLCMIQLKAEGTPDKSADFRNLECSLIYFAT